MLIRYIITTCEQQNLEIFEADSYRENEEYSTQNLNVLLRELTANVAIDLYSRNSSTIVDAVFLLNLDTPFVREL